MPSVIRIRPASHVLLTKLAARRCATIQDTLDAALQELDRKLFFEQYQADARALRNDPIAWAEELEERKVWDNALMDGLKNEPWEKAPVAKPRKRKRA